MSLFREWFEAAPARRLALLRVLAGGFALGYLLVRAPHLASFATFDASRFRPVGIVSMLIDSPLDAWVVRSLVVAAVAAGFGYVAGWRFRVFGPLFAMLLLWVTSYRNSWGLVLHTENLMVLQVMVLGLVRSADAYSLDARRPAREPKLGYGWPIKLLMVVTVLTYFVSGWAKVRNGGWDWVSGDVLRNQIANDNLRKLQLGDFYSPLGGWLVQFGWVFPPMALASLVIELGAPLALIRRWAGRLWVAGVWLFHLGILFLMAIVFPYQLVGVGLAPFFAVEEVWDRLKARRRRPTARSVSEVPDQAG